MRSTTISSLSKGLLRGSSCAGSRGCQQESQQQQQQQPRRCAASLGSNRGRSNHRSGFDGFAASPAPAATVVSPSAKEANLDHAKFKPGCVIFDKDGTLVCFHTMWSPWCTSLANRMSKSTGMTDISGSLYDVLGYDHAEEKVRIGALAENTHPQIKDKIYDMLREEKGLDEHKAQRVIEDTWLDTPEDLSIKLTGNLHRLFHKLKSEGVKIAICTSDSKEGTLEFVHRQGLSKYIDMMVCGDDPQSRPKPDPHNAMWICDTLGVRPADTIMVGDTPADTLMGQQAKLGLTVGVLSGVGGVGDLIDADVIVNDITTMIDLILPEDPDQQKIHHVTTRGLTKIARGSSLFGVNRDRHGAGFASPSARARFFSTTSSANATKTGYSHIVVGAGSAGCVVSNRLSEERQ